MLTFCEMRKSKLLIISLTTLICFYAIPTEMVFLKLWCGLMLGMFIATTTEIITNFNQHHRVSVALELNTDTPLSKSIAAQFFVSFIFAIVSITFVIPNIIFENKEADMLRNTIITAASIKNCSETAIIKLDQSEVNDIQQFIHMAEVYYPSHETGDNDFKLVLTTNNGILAYKADIPAHHKNAVRITFKRWLGYSHILIPELGFYLKPKLALLPKRCSP